MSYITVDNLNVINAEMTNWCNAACPRCARFTWNELKLRKFYEKNKTKNKKSQLKLFD